MRKAIVLSTVALASLVAMVIYSGPASAASLSKKVKALEKKVKELEKKLSKVSAQQGPQGPAGLPGENGSQGPKGDKPSTGEYLAATSIQGTTSASGKAPMLGSDGRLSWNAFPFKALIGFIEKEGTTTATAACPSDPDGAGPQMYAATSGAGIAPTGQSIKESYPSNSSGVLMLIGANHWTVKATGSGTTKAIVSCTLLYSTPPL